MKETKTTKRDKASHNQRGGTQDAALASSQALSALMSVVDETVKLFHRLRVVVEQIHRQEEMSAGRRGVLKGLDRFGPQTVPQMARVRPVSRQYIQTLVNQLAEEDLVEFIENPAHRRSLLVRLTRRGKDLVDGMNRREEKLLAGLEIGVEKKDLRAAAAVLRALRELFESNQWKRSLKIEGGKK